MGNVELMVLYRLVVVFALLILTPAVLIGDANDMQEFMLKTAMDCKNSGTNCVDCEHIAVFMYDQENMDSPDFVPLGNIQRWRQKFRFYCLGVMGG